MLQHRYPLNDSVDRYFESRLARRQVRRDRFRERVQRVRFCHAHVQRACLLQRARIRARSGRPRVWAVAVRRDTALNGLEPDARLAGAGELAQQGDAQAGFADARSAPEHYDTRQASSTAPLSRAMSVSVNVAFTVSRSRADPVG